VQELEVAPTCTESEFISDVQSGKQIEGDRNTSPLFFSANEGFSISTGILAEANLA
jgi:hypothetical protein